MKKFYSIQLMGLLACLYSFSTQAQTQLNIQQNSIVDEVKLSVRDLGWMDKSHMEKEVQKVDQLAQLKLGMQLHQNLSDLNLLQQLVDKNWVKNDDTSLQQAMGMALGNIMLADFPNTLEWKIYEDSLGRSRAVCAKGTKECIFPVTMIQRRMQIGTHPEMQKLYDNALARMEKFLPQIPYGGGILHKLEH
jgi:hypothetical protein